MLVGQRAVGRLLAEGLAFDLPLIITMFEVLEQNVGAREASDDEAQSLSEDGIEVARIPWVPPSDA